MENKKNLIIAPLAQLVAMAMLLVISASCEIIDLIGAQGELRLSFSDNSYNTTKASSEIPDTNSFILNVVDSKGNTVYNGKYGDSPESLLVSAGSYTVTALSGEFSSPKFSSPQYGDKQLVVVSAGKVANVELLCRQMNAGVRLKVGADFLKAYPDGSLFLKSDQGKLLYAYREKRIAYFKPGNVSLILSNQGKDETVFSRILESQEILTLNINAPQDGVTKGGVHIAVDTTRYWNSSDVTIGDKSGTGGGDKGKALSVAQARGSAGSEDVWVYGYVVGGDLSSSSASFSTPFKSRTNLLLGTRSSSSDKGSCLSVQLLKGDIRDALNLVDNPDILGTQIFLKGDIVESYYGIPGIQNITEYEIK